MRSIVYLKVNHPVYFIYIVNEKYHLLIYFLVRVQDIIANNVLICLFHIISDFSETSIPERKNL